MGYDMTPEQFEEEMRNAASFGPEEGHSAMDDVMVKLLRSLGYGKGCDVFEKATKWYA